MQLIDESKRDKVYWKYLNGAKDFLFMDFYSYVCIEMNIRKAIKSRGNIDEYYDREGWIRLLMYYAKALEELVYTYAEAWYIVPQKLMSELAFLEHIPTKIKNSTAIHETNMSDNEILKLVIMVAKYIESIMKTVIDIDLNEVEKQIRTIENGKHKQKYSETEESELEEEY